jgi:Lipid A 3-O-deacylase (PagL)
MRTPLLTALMVLLTLPACALSQSFEDASSNSINPSATSDTPRYREISFYAAQSFGYPKIMSDLKDQRLTMFGGRFTGLLYRFPHLNLNGNIDLKPLALYSHDVNGPRQYAYGGAVEIGLQIVPHTHWRCQPYFEVNGGTIMFTRNIPTADARRVNLCIDFTPGFYIAVGENRAIKTGLGFYHFSNDYTVRHNPGFDSFMLYVAYSFRNLPALHLHRGP